MAYPVLPRGRKLLALALALVVALWSHPPPAAGDPAGRGRLPSGEVITDPAGRGRLLSGQVRGGLSEGKGLVETWESLGIPGIPGHTRMLYQDEDDEDALGLARARRGRRRRAQEGAGREIPFPRAGKETFMEAFLAARNKSLGQARRGSLLWRSMATP